MSNISISHHSLHAAQPSPKRNRGFTIVELLIVIVVSAILAAISIVSYNNIQARAKNTARLTMAENTIKLLELYKATYGEYPKLEAGKGYCIGTGYPNGKCRDTNVGGSSYLETDTTLSDELKKIGTIPTGNYSEVGNTVGPYAIASAGGFNVNILFDKSAMTDCPSVVPIKSWVATADNRMICRQDLYYN
ncbi:MAG: type II secretion system protein [Candidatus Saccharimonas sp.]